MSRATLPNRPTSLPAKYPLQVAPEVAEATALALLAGGGALLSKDTGDPLRDMVRGGFRGLSLGGGVSAGARIGAHLGGEENAVPVGALGALLGGGAGWVLSGQLSRLSGLRPDEEKEQLYVPKSNDLLEALSTRLKGASVLGVLRHAKRESDRGNYLVKHRLIRKLMFDSPKDFFIDSEEGDTVGMTHRPTSFKFHLPRRVIPNEMFDFVQ